MIPTWILLCVIIGLIFYLGSRKPKGYPPGPRWWPILGSALEVARLRKKTGYLYDTCTRLAEQYGPVVGLKIGADRIVVLNDYESMRSMLTNDDCDGRPMGPMYYMRTMGKRRGVLVTDGRLWVQQRRFLLRHLRDLGWGRNDMAQMIEDEAGILVEHFKKLIKQNDHNNDVEVNKNYYSNTENNNNFNGQIYQLLQKPNDVAPRKKTPTITDMYVNAENYKEIRKVSQNRGIVLSIYESFGVSTLNALWRMMAGKRFQADDQKLNHLQRILTVLLQELDMIGCLFGHFPFLRFVAPELSGYNKFMDTHEQLWEFLKEELKTHKMKCDMNNPSDLMSVYLAILKSEARDDTFTESQLVAICMDLFMAGSETTTKALSFCFLYLILYPDTQKKAQEEIDKVVARDRHPCVADRPRMPYVHAIVLESLRLFMGRCLNIPHRALKDTVISGYRIPKDTMIVANFNRVLMNDVWGDPEMFRPERFIDASGKVFMPDHYIPFSFGKHRCMGEVLARSNLFVIIASLLQTFTFATVPGEEKPVAGVIDGVTPTPKPYKVLVSLRP